MSSQLQYTECSLCLHRTSKRIQSILYWRINTRVSGTSSGCPPNLHTTGDAGGYDTLLELMLQLLHGPRSSQCDLSHPFYQCMCLQIQMQSQCCKVVRVVLDYLIICFLNICIQATSLRIGHSRSVSLTVEQHSQICFRRERQPILTPHWINL